MFYTHSTLDRADHLRKDEAQLQSLRTQDNARLLPVWQNQSLVASQIEPIPPQALHLHSRHPIPDEQCIFLGLDEDVPYFAVDVSGLNEDARDALAAQAHSRNGQSLPGEFADLRVTGPTLPAADGSMLAYARGLVYWNSHTRHCIRCGHALESMNGGHVRKCANSDCGYLVFPRTDPAVIMLVSYQPADGSEPLCLLGRSPAWPEGVFSTLAGFVEPGESLEAAVQREVLEEVGVSTIEARYIASQPWPFPRSIMLGFEAIATSTDINCDPDEIADAQWFTRKQLEGFGDWGDDSDNYKLPRKDSIARHLIERWMTTTSS